MVGKVFLTPVIPATENRPSELATLLTYTPLEGGRHLYYKTIKYAYV